ncbi:MAG: alpha-amylase family glycosyl hydrolase [Flavobacteriaceae bacterium]|nr:alpha-amylase family glycosyl hydrolase [Flavobacteriaceae bacterium]
MKKIFIFLAILGVWACQEPQADETKAISNVLSSPVRMQIDSTRIVLEDYVLNYHKIDSIGQNQAFHTNWNQGDNALVLKTNESFAPIENLRIYLDGQTVDIPLFKSEKKMQRLLLPSKEPIENLFIKGEFTNWQLKQLQYDAKNKTYVYEKALASGQYEYVLQIDGKDQADPNNTLQKSNGMGGTNSIWKIENNKGEAPFIELTSNSDHGFIINAPEGINKVLVYNDAQLVFNKQVSKTQKQLAFSPIAKPKKGRSMLRIVAANSNGRSNDLLLPLQDGKPIEDPKLLTRSDFHSNVLYFLMVDRFKDGNPQNTKKVANDSIHPKANYYGGDLEGILQKIESGYFKNLGINTIWLSPITQNPEGAFGLWPDPLTKFSAYHGYWPISNTKVDYRFGSEAVLKKLLQKAHAQDINVILDYVANHVHRDHPIIQANPDWATPLYLPDGTMNTEKWDEHRLTTWFDTFLPTLDFSKPEVVEQMTDSAAFWITKYDLDGFRHDATKHIQLEFWRTLTKKIKNRSNRPIFQIGETYGSYELINSYINNGMLDGQFDFNLYDAAVQTFANKQSFKQLAIAVEKSLKYYGHHHLMGNISGNQDKARFISYASRDVSFTEDAKAAGWQRVVGMSDTTAYKKLELLHAFNLSMPGIPCIYYGDEYGSIGGNDPDNRKQMQFEGLNKHEDRLKKQVSSLIKKRRNNMPLLYGDFRWIEVSDTHGVAKRRYLDQEITLIFNTGNTDINYKNHTVPPMGYAIVKN